MKVGILAVQGNFEAHACVMRALGVAYHLVNHPKQLSGIQGLILPGGESTTMLKFLLENQFLEAIQEFALAGRCLFGTCAGAILLAKKVLNPEQVSLNLMDIIIERNAYGRQLDSQIVKGDFLGQRANLDMVFIRAPRIVNIGPGVAVFASYQQEPVGVSEQNWLLTTFHPELTASTAIHQLFISKCRLI
jgi:pyridoxal 5'-phosphate synthase pdxT subunit